MEPHHVPVSILIPTYNEERNLTACLESVVWACEVIVVDSYSQDGTENIAIGHGAQFIQHPFENYAAQKNWALDSLEFSQEWVLIMDADERVSPELAVEIAGVVERDQSSRPVGYYINRRFIFMGRWIRHCGWYPSWNLRLFRRGEARYEERPVHEHMVVQGPTGYLQHHLVHEDRRGLTAWLARHNEYSTMEAQARWRAQQYPSSTGLRPQWRGSPVERKRAIREYMWPWLPAKPLLWFLYLYLRLGFLDGWQGFAFCLLQGMQEFHVGLKLRELRLGNVRETSVY